MERTDIMDAQQALVAGETEGARRATGVSPARGAVERARTLGSQSWPERRGYITGRLRRFWTRNNLELSSMEPLMVARSKVERATVGAISRYSPKPFPGRVALVMPNRAYLRSGTAPLRWQTVAQHAETSTLVVVQPELPVPQLPLLEPRQERRQYHLWKHP